MCVWGLRLSLPTSRGIDTWTVTITSFTFIVFTRGRVRRVFVVCFFRGTFYGGSEGKSGVGVHPCRRLVDRTPCSVECGAYDAASPTLVPLKP